MNRLYRKCGSLDVSQTYGPIRSLTGVALLVLFHFSVKNVVPNSFLSNKYLASYPLIPMPIFM
jgi:hypothetical protein